ncbi:MAG: Gfo/Idh/MocA family protein [Carbonactinosporaceae bacterium]
MKIGLAGAGRVGAFHAELLRTLPEVDRLVVADADVSRARAVARRLEVDAVGDVEELFGSGLDGLVITAATDAHAPLIKQAATAGVPVFCEKPLARDVAGTLEVIEVVEDAGIPVQVGFQRRFDAGHRAVRDALRSGRLGWVHTLRSCTLDPAPPTPEYVSASGGMFRDCGVHDFDVIRWVTGREVVEAFAVGANRGAAYFREHGDVDTGAALLTLDDDTIAVVSCTRYNAAGYDVRLELLGSTDSTVAGLDGRAPLTPADPGGVRRSGSDCRVYRHFTERFRDAYAAELRAFANLVGKGGESPCTPADALEALYVAEACERSRRERRPVRLDEVRW